MNDTVYLDRRQAVPFYRTRALDPHPNLTHAIFTRLGGVSPDPFHSLNWSVVVGDAPTTVERNFRRACETLAVTPQQTVTCDLVHGAAVLTVDSPTPRVAGEADALITDTAGLMLTMRFADCTPLLFFEPARRLVGLAHAGWRGTIRNVAAATVAAMVKQGCRRERIIAVIGPSIGPCCYEVGAEVISQVQATFKQADRLLRPNGRAQHALFDLWAANCQQLSEAGVQTIVTTGLCTACRTDEFFSHRAEQGRTGRFGVMIGLQETKSI